MYQKINKFHNVKNSAVSLRKVRTTRKRIFATQTMYMLIIRKDNIGNLTLSVYTLSRKKGNVNRHLLSP